MGSRLDALHGAGDSCGGPTERGGYRIRASDAGHVGSAEQSPGFSGIEAYVRWSIGDHDGARAIIRQLEALPADRWMVATAKALAHASSDTARALAAMEEALRKREIPVSWTPLSDRLYDPLRDSRRFAAVLRGYGLDERTFRPRTPPAGAARERR